MSHERILPLSAIVSMYPGYSVTVVGPGLAPFEGFVPHDPKGHIVYANAYDAFAARQRLRYLEARTRQLETENGRLRGDLATLGTRL